MDLLFGTRTTATKQNFLKMTRSLYYSIHLTLPQYMTLLDNSANSDSSRRGMMEALMLASRPPTCSSRDPHYVSLRKPFSNIPNQITPDCTYLDDLLSSCTPNGPSHTSARKPILRGPPPRLTCEQAYGWAPHALLTPPQLPPLTALLSGNFSDVGSSTWYNVKFGVSREQERPPSDGGDFKLKGQITLPERWPSEKEGARGCLSFAEF